jgi:HEAT repeat protein
MNSKLVMEAVAASQSAQRPAPPQPPARAPTSADERAWLDLLSQVEEREEEEAKSKGPKGAASASHAVDNPVPQVMDASGQIRRHRRHRPGQAGAARVRSAVAAGNLTGAAGIAPAAYAMLTSEDAPPPPQVRQGQDGFSVAVFLLYAMAWFGVIFYMGYIGHQQALKQLQDQGHSVANLSFPYLAVLTVAGVGLGINLVINVPLLSIGVRLTARIFKFQFLGSPYLNTLGWVSCSSLFVLLGMCCDKPLSGVFGAAAILLMPLVFHLVFGMKFVESLVAFCLTIAISMSAWLLVGLVIVGILSAQGTTLDAVMADYTPDRQAQLAMQSAAQSPVTDPAGVGVNRPPGPTTAPTAADQAAAAAALQARSAAQDAAAMEEMTSLANTDPGQGERGQQVQSIEQALSSDTPQVRMAALRALLVWSPEAGDVQLAKALSETGHDRDATLRKFVLEQILARKPQAAIAPLVDGLGRHEDVEPVLVAYGDAVIEPVTQRVGFFQENTQQAALRVLAAIKSEPALAAIRDLALTGSPQTMADARAVWKTIDPEHYDPVELALADLKSMRRESRVQGLKILANTPLNRSRQMAVNDAFHELIDHIDEEEAADLGAAMKVWATLATVNNIINEHLLKEYGSSWTRGRVMIVLSEMKEPRAVEPISMWLIKDTKNARAALIRMGPMVEPRMLELLLHRNEEAATAAAQVLGEVGGKRALPLLRQATHNSTRPIAAEAAAIAVELIEERLRQTQDPTPDAPSAPSATP